jgi:predicted DNA-binding transcriptional regulator AlpA
MSQVPAPSLAQIKRWPPAVNVEDAARALGISRATAYLALAEGRFPVKTVIVGRRIKIVTADLLAHLSADSETAGAAS